MENELRFPWEWNFSHVSLVQVQRYAGGLWMLYGQGIPRVNRMFPDRVRRSLDGWYVVAKRLDYSANFLF